MPGSVEQLRNQDQLVPNRCLIQTEDHIRPRPLFKLNQLKDSIKGIFVSGFLKVFESTLYLGYGPLRDGR